MSANAADNTQPLILVIDDDEAIRDALRIGLESSGYRAIVTDDGAAAMRLVKSEHPAVLVLDLYMPETDGFEVMSALKSAAVEVPIIVMSGGVAGHPGDLLPMALDFGAAAALRKPFAIADLDAAIRKVIGKAR
ncbi:MAG TPA: response regulator [Dongiaceae bacterium]|nr:response regulator [Dongiaceae bacterium]